MSVNWETIFTSGSENAKKINIVYKKDTINIAFLGLTIIRKAFKTYA